MPFAFALRCAWQRRLAAAAGVLLLLWALAWLAVPPLLKWQAQHRLSEWLGRPVSIGAVDFRPWSLELTVRDLSVGGPSAAGTPPLRWARAYVNADAASLWRRAPVIAALEIDGLALNVTHLGSGRYDIDDVLARLAPDPAAPPDGGPPARFALYNLRLHDAAVTFDDRPAGRTHRIESLQLALPFLSNLPSHLEVTVQPRLAFRLDGANFDSNADATPFAQRQHGELRLAVGQLDLGRYAVYLPAGVPLRLARGALDADLRLRFEKADDAEPSVVLAGKAVLKDVALQDAEGAPLLGWKQLRVDLADVRPLVRRVALGDVRLQGAQLHLARDGAGRLNLQRLGGAAAPPAPATTASAAAAAQGGAPWQATLARLEVDDAQLLWRDASVTPAAALQLDAMRLRGEALAWPMREAMPVSFAATLRSPAVQDMATRLALDARVSDRAAEGSATLEALDLAALGPYLAGWLRPRLEGQASLKGRFEWRGEAAAPALRLQLEQGALDALRLASGSGRAAREELSVRRLAVEAARVDLAAREIDLGRWRIERPSVELARDGQGRWNVESFAAPAAATPASDAVPAPPWTLRLADLQLDAGRLRLSDRFAPGRAADTPARVDVSALRLRVQELAWPQGKGVAPARVQLGARIAGVAAAGEPAPAAGSVEWNGRIAPDPWRVAGRLRVERLPVHVFEPYVADQLPVALLRAEAGWQGELDLRRAAAGWTVEASGDARLADVRVHTRGEVAGTAGDELLSWQSFALEGVRLAMAPQATPQLEIRAAALNDFFARLVVTEQGRLNLSSVKATDAPAGPAEAASAPPARAASAPAGGELPIAVAVGGVKLANGRVDFSDRFIRPNYSANLTELNGTLGAFRSGSREMATLELRGRAAGTALLEVRGALNPTADPLALDIQAKATDLELAPLSPYAGKYAGYAIERGKLSMEVAYKIAPDGKLEARNQVILNQLTFGDKVESPDATKLPVLLAVALLKDRHGVIDINLPISGSINDPQFSVFGIVLKVIGNLLVKALTAPFALLAGGGGEDLSVVEFRPGTAMLAEGSVATLDKVARALADRESLKMTVTGAADAVGEREAYQQAVLEARLLAERRRELLRGGASAAEAEALAALDAPTRARVLKELYRATDLPDKPRNALGFARDIPGPEMEALLKRRIAVSADAMRELALQRGLAVRDALLAKGLPGERLFLAAPKLRAAGEDDAGWTPRVQLSLSTR